MTDINFIKLNSVQFNYLIERVAKTVKEDIKKSEIKIIYIQEMEKQYESINEEPPQSLYEYYDEDDEKSNE